MILDMVNENIHEALRNSKMTKLKNIWKQK
jgi:hypothetical protein